VGQKEQSDFLKIVLSLLKKDTSRNRSTNLEPDRTKQKHQHKPLGEPSESVFSFPFPKQLKQALRLTLDGTQLMLAINLRLMTRGILF
jgi:hypothetical protein